MADTLHIVVVHFNPEMWVSHKRLRLEFLARYANCGAPIYVVELALGERPFEVIDRSNPRHLGLRSQEEVPWIKENLINIGIRKLVPPDAKYVAWIDGDVILSNPTWVGDTLNELHRVPVLQMFGECVDLGPSRQIVTTERGGEDYVRHSFAKLYVEDRAGFRPRGVYKNEHCGYAWAARLDFLRRIDPIDPLIDWSIIGSADWQMACNFIGQSSYAFHGDMQASFSMRNAIFAKKALAYGGKDLSFIPGLLQHEWHGAKKARNYVGRWQMLIDNKYDPDFDINYRSDGLLQWTGHNKPLQLAYRDYSRARNEDSIDT